VCSKLMNDSLSDWDGIEHEDPIDAGLAAVDNWISPELKIQRRKEIHETLRLMELRISSGQFDQSVDPDFFFRKKQLEAELCDLDF
jgi:hypothetical protein